MCLAKNNNKKTNLHGDVLGKNNNKNKNAHTQTTTTTKTKNSDVLGKKKKKKKKKEEEEPAGIPRSVTLKSAWSTTEFSPF